MDVGGTGMDDRGDVELGDRSGGGSKIPSGLDAGQRDAAAVAANGVRLGSSPASSVPAHVEVPKMPDVPGEWGYIEGTKEYSMGKWGYAFSVASDLKFHMRGSINALQGGAQPDMGNIANTLNMVVKIMDHDGLEDKDRLQLLASGADLLLEANRLGVSPNAWGGIPEGNQREDIRQQFKEFGRIVAEKNPLGRQKEAWEGLKKASQEGVQAFFEHLTTYISTWFDLLIGGRGLPIAKNTIFLHGQHRNWKDASETLITKGKEIQQATWQAH